MPSTAGPVITTEAIHALVPFARLLDVRFSTLTPESVVAHLASLTEYGTLGGGVHGGAQMALADITAAVMGVLASGDPSSTPATVQSSSNFLHPARGALTATATAVRRGPPRSVDCGRR